MEAGWKYHGISMEDGIVWETVQNLEIMWKWYGNSVELVWNSEIAWK